MISVIYTFGLIFVLSALFLFIFHKLFNLTIPAYIIAGMVGGLFLAEQGLLELLQWGIAFVVFIFGAKLEPDKLKHGISGGLINVVTHISVIGVGSFVLLYLLGLDALNSIFVSAALVFSSSLTGTELSEKYATMELLYARLAEATDVVHDILAIFLIVLLSPVLFSVNIFYALGITGGMLVISLIFRKFVFPWLFKISDSSEELMMLSGISMLSLMIIISQYFGISIVVGAFIAGLAFSRFPYNIELVESMESLKDFFAAILFFSLGALVVFPDTQTLIIASGIIFVTVFVKPLLTAISLIYYGYDKRTAYRCALTLDQVSEFVLIIAIQAYLVDLIAPYVFQGIILATTVTMITTAITDNYSDKLRDWLSEKLPFETPKKLQRYRTQIKTPLQDHIIVVGYDAQGERIGEYLQNKEKEFVVIELNPEILESDHELENYIFRSAKDDESWKLANYKEASMIISTPPQKHISEKVLSLDTKARKVVRTNKFDDAKDLLDQGADYVMVPDLLASEQLVDYIEEFMYGDQETIRSIRESLLDELRKHVDWFE